MRAVQLAGKRMQTAWRLLPIAAVLLLSACALAPRVPQPQVPLPKHYSQAPALGPRPDLQHWWRQFHDPQLDALVQRALAQNLSLQAAGQRLAAARALLGNARAHYLPQASVYTNQEPTPGSTASYFQIGFQAIWQLGLFGRRTSEERLGVAQAQLAAADHAAAQVALVAQVVRAYLDGRAAQVRAQLDAQLLAQAQRQAQVVGVQVAQHLATAAAGTQAEAALAAARARQQRAAADIAIAQQQLAVLLSSATVHDLLPGTGSVPLPPATPPALPPAELLRTRPDIQRAEAGILAAAGRLGIARADLYPRLALGWTSTGSARTAGGNIGELHFIPSFGPVIDMPIFDWGLRQARVRSDGHELAAAVLDYRQTVLAAAGEVEQAYARLHAAQAATEAAAAAATATQQAAAAASVRARLGLADALAQVRAEQDALQARRALADARAGEGVAWVALYDALGGASPLAAAGNVTTAEPAR